MPRPALRRAAGAAGLLFLVAAAPGLAQLPLQSLVDATPAGGELVLPAGDYDGPVVIDKPLTLSGPGARIGASPGPAIEVRAGPVVLAGLALTAPGPVVVAHDASSVEVRDVTGGAVIEAHRVGVLRVGAQGSLPLPPVRAEDTLVVLGRLVAFQVRYVDGEPWPGAEVQVWDGGALAFAARTDASGLVGPVFVAERFEAYAGGGLRTGANDTLVRAPAAGIASPVLAADGVMVLRSAALPPWTDVAHQGPAVQLGLAALVALALVALALRLHQGLRWRWLMLLLPLFTRLAREDLLGNDTRDAIYAHIQSRPGTHLRALERELSVPLGTLLHHVRMLEQQRFVVSEKDGRLRRFYVEGERVPGADPLGASVLRFVQEHPGATLTEVAQALGRLPSLVHYHVERLVDAGTVARQRQGRVVRLFPIRPSGTASTK